MEALATTERGGKIKVGAWLPAEQVGELDQIGRDKGEDRSYALRLAVRLGLEALRQLTPTERSLQ